jgi:hypothetical protein
MANQSDSDFMYNWIREKSGKKTNMETKQTTVWTCQFCGKDTSNVDYDYLVGTNHLACQLGQDMKDVAEYRKDNPIETCIVCGIDTVYRLNEHIDMRYGYVEGAGQLCKDCYEGKTTTTSTEEIMRRRTTLITVSEEDILNTSNDADLGALVRRRYWESK